ncbi:hypothetical protein BU25DRAFT_237462 [Macroventuria anomochaeta]|uniref:Uncharacterized protein n=1 Tax=Macroventuria anomochaeta TaxID=301207 RepID=A0ACB6RI34_9PLEO|nr:uncharacterized protein BU25DRAFT_237462 [Macroventuria anomochaeta]KAF2621424.1 hypothetical protein BU25DRAFT_237462 [Macroventuria anomochaeta]
MVATRTSTHASSKTTLLSTGPAKSSLSARTAKSSTSVVLLAAKATRPTHPTFHAAVMVTFAHATAHAWPVVHAAAEAALLKLLRLLLVSALLGDFVGSRYVCDCPGCRPKVIRKVIWSLKMLVMISSKLDEVVDHIYTYRDLSLMRHCSEVIYDLSAASPTRLGATLNTAKQDEKHFLLWTLRGMTMHSLILRHTTRLRPTWFGPSGHEARWLVQPCFA